MTTMLYQVETEEAPTEPRVRYRVNVSTSTKGVKTYEATVELIGNATELSVARILQESDQLVAELDRRYPPQVS